MRARAHLTALVLAAATALGVASPAPAADATATPDRAATATPSATSRWSFSGFRDSTQAIYNTEAFVAPGRTPVIGQFYGTANRDILWVTPGAGGDRLQVNQGQVTFYDSLIDVSVNGTYTPYVGTFASPDGFDDVLWYSTTGASQLWDFNGTSQNPITKTALPEVTGPGQVLIGDFALDGVDDVVRYRPGTASDSWWDFQPNGRTTRPFNVNGTYTPLVGAFGSDGYDDIFWYGPGATPDSLWDFVGGGARTEWSVSVSGTYTPVVGTFTTDGRDDIIWYRPGTGADSIWDFDGTGYTSKALTVNGTYTPVVCSCIGSSLVDDVIWYRPGSATDAAWQVGATGDFTYASKDASVPGSGIAGAGKFGTANELLLVKA